MTHYRTTTFAVSVTTNSDIGDTKVAIRIGYGRGVPSQTISDTLPSKEQAMRFIDDTVYRYTRYP